MVYLSNMYELPPIDDWSKSLSLKKVFGMYADQVEEEVYYRVYHHSKEDPHTIKCGVIGNPNGANFEPIVYAKISNNGTVYAFTDAVIDGYEKVNEQHETLVGTDFSEDDLPF